MILLEPVINFAELIVLSGCIENIRGILYEK